MSKTFVEEQAGSDPEKQRAWLRSFLAANGKKLCEGCGCCEMTTRVCYQCGGDGVDGHDCGEDTCCCLHPDENETCDICDGEGGWEVCIGCCGPEEDD
jgi:hypothetical protein